MKNTTVFRKGATLYMNNEGKLGEVYKSCPSTNKAKKESRSIQQKGEIVRVW